MPLTRDTLAMWFTCNLSTNRHTATTSHLSYMGLAGPNPSKPTQRCHLSRMASFVQLPLVGGKTFFLKTKLEAGGREGMQLTLTDCSKFWQGQLTEEDLDTLSSSLSMEFSTFIAHTVAAFTRTNMADATYVYQTKPKANGSLDFFWKQEVGDIKILMGSVMLHEEAGQGRALSQIFTSCISSTSKLQEKISRLEAENQRLEQERHNALKRLEKCVSAKEELEQDLFAKFAAVLNSKKDLIRSLQEGKGDQDPSLPSSVIVKSKPGRVSSDADSTPPHSPGSNQRDSDGWKDKDTDDETPSPRKRFLIDPTRLTRDDIVKGVADGADVIKEAERSLASARAILGESLDLGDDGSDGDKGKAVVRRPVRQGQGAKRSSPVKPVLPKVSSTRTPEPTGKKTPSRSALRKSGSGNSSSIDMDDLLKDF